VTAGTDRLHEQLSAIGEALEAFDDPVTDELAGLRLMRSTSRERQAHLQSTITESETCSLELAIQGAPADGALAVPFALEVLGALQDAVTAVAGRLLDDDAAAPAAQHVTAAVTLHLAELSTKECVTVTLQRSPGPLTAQLVEPASGAPLVERALDRVLAALEAVGDRASGSDSDDVAPPAEPVELRLALAPTILEPRELTLTRADAQRLAAALTSRRRRPPAIARAAPSPYLCVRSSRDDGEPRREQPGVRQHRGLDRTAMGTATRLQGQP